MFDNITAEEVLSLAAMAGNAIAKQWGETHEADELASEAVTVLLEKVREGHVKTHSERDYIYGVLKEKAEKHLHELRYQKMMTNAAIKFTEKEVKSFLEKATWDKRAPFPVRPDGGGDWMFGDSPVSKREKVTIWVRLDDFLHAYCNYLTTDQQEALAQFYRDGSREGHPQTRARAVRRLTRNVNRRINRSAEEGTVGREGAGSSKSLTNSKAQYITSVESGMNEEAGGPDGTPNLSPVHELQDEREAQVNGEYAYLRRLRDIPGAPLPAWMVKEGDSDPTLAGRFFDWSKCNR